MDYVESAESANRAKEVDLVLSSVFVFWKLEGTFHFL